MILSLLRSSRLLKILLEKFIREKFLPDFMKNCKESMTLVANIDSIMLEWFSQKTRRVTRFIRVDFRVGSSKIPKFSLKANALRMLEIGTMKSRWSINPIGM